MLGILSLLLGGVVSNLPSIIQVLSKSVDGKQQLELIKLQNELNYDKERFANAAAAARAIVDEQKSARDADSSINYTGFWANVRQSIRPVITYLFISLFFIAKGILVTMMISSGVDPLNAIMVVLDQTTNELVTVIIGFWFGGRIGEKIYLNMTKKE